MSKTLKQFLWESLKEGISHIFFMAIIVFGYWAVLRLFFPAMDYLMKEYPDQKERINDFGLLLLGYVGITFFLSMIKKFERT